MLLRSLGRATRRAPRALSSLTSMTPSGGVHGSQKSVEARSWRQKPLLRVHGDELYFKTGSDAVKLLVNEAERRDHDKPLYLKQFADLVSKLRPVFDRSPKYAWLAKILLEPERCVSFKVTYIDDWGNARTNRGWRIQHCSALGPYGGGLHFGRHVTENLLRAQSFDATFANALTGRRLGGAAGGANFEPSLASEAEIQRFCQAFMTELQKYVGPGLDLPSMGVNCGSTEIGYMYGQYKRTSTNLSKHGFGMLWGGSVPHPEVHGYGPVAFAKHYLENKGDSLVGKRCLVTGSGKVALAVADYLVKEGALPLTLSDTSGHVYEEQGLKPAKLEQISTIKAERGARIGRYIVASTTARYNDPADIWAVPCDLAFPTNSGELDENAAEALALNGCTTIVDAGYAPTTPEAISTLKKLGVTHCPFRATLAIGNALAYTSKEEQIIKTDISDEIDREGKRIFEEVQRSAAEYNVRGDLGAGAATASFLRVANVMASHGSV